jgi:hypothetical protein
MLIRLVKMSFANILALVTTALIIPGPLTALADTGNEGNFTSSVATLPDKEQSIAKASVDRIAMIQSPDGGLCSGSLVDRDLVLTAWHCVDKLRTYRVSFHKSSVNFSAVVVAEDRRNDLAILRLNSEPKLKPLAVAPATKSLVAGDRVVTIGHPLGVLFTASAGQAIEPTERFFLFNAKINSGNSGGPIFNIDGQITGVAIILNQLFGERELGDAVAAKPIRDILAKAAPRKEVSWRAANGTGVFDLAYGRDALLEKLSGSENGAFVYAIGQDFYDRWRVAFRHYTLRPERVWGFETGPVFKTILGDPAVLFGRNYYSAGSKSAVANKIGIAFEFWFLDITVSHIMHNDKGYTAYTIGF